MASSPLPRWAALLKSPQFKKGTLVVAVVGGSAALIRYWRSNKPKKEASKAVARRQRDRVNLDAVFFKVSVPASFFLLFFFFFSSFFFSLPFSPFATAMRG